MTDEQYAELMALLRAIGREIRDIGVLLQTDASQKARVALLEAQIGRTKKRAPPPETGVQP